MLSLKSPALLFHSLWQFTGVLRRHGGDFILRIGGVLATAIILAAFIVEVPVPPCRIYASADSNVRLQIDSRIAKLGQLDVIDDGHTVMSGLVWFRPVRGHWFGGLIVDLSRGELHEFLIMPGPTGLELITTGGHRAQLLPLAAD